MSLRNITDDNSSVLNYNKENVQIGKTDLSLDGKSSISTVVDDKFPEDSENVWFDPDHLPDDEDGVFNEFNGERISEIILQSNLADAVRKVRSQRRIRFIRTEIADYGSVKQPRVRNLISSLEILGIKLKITDIISPSRNGGELLSDCLSLWKVIKDILFTAILYGYNVGLEDVELRIQRIWFHWIYLMRTFNVNFIKTIKYKLAAFASFAKKSTMFPKSPFPGEDPNLILDPAFTKFIKCSMARTGLKARLYHMSLVDSICRGVKKGADRPTEEMCVKSCIDTVRLFTRNDKPMLTKVTVVDSENEYVVVTNPEVIQIELYRTVDELFKNAPKFEPTFSHVPSFSSGTGARRGDGGQFRVVREKMPTINKELHYKARHGLHWDDYKKIKIFNLPDSIIIKPNEVEFDLIDERKTLDYIEFKSKGKVLTDREIDNLIVECLNEDPIIHPIGLAEALKVRGITTPNSLETWLLKPLQKYLSKLLLRFPVFKVTGEPLTSEILDGIFAGTTTADGWFLSGDYDNATNEMNSIYTRIVIRYICEKLNLSPLYSRLAERSLVDNYIYYDYIPEQMEECDDAGVHVEKFEEEGETPAHLRIGGKQLEAQPMGKILSFVTLCIINFTVCRRACEMDSNKKIPIRKFKGLINGDDCVFRIKNFEIWSDVSSCVGLFNSIGKTFYSDEFIEMNSRSFILHANHLYETPFVNWGLLRCKKRSSVHGEGQDSFNDKFLNIGAVHRDLMKGLHFIYSELNTLFRYMNNTFLLDKTLTQIPYYVPEWLGALGLDPGPDPEKQITFLQRQQSFIILKKIKKEVVVHPSRLVQCKLDFFVNDMVQRLFNNGNVPRVSTRHILDEFGEIRDLEKDNLDIYNEFIEQIWRNLDTNLVYEKANAVLEKQADKLFWQKFYKNKHLWSKSEVKFRCILPKFNVPEPQPIPWERLWHQPQDDYLPLVFREDFSCKDSITLDVNSRVLKGRSCDLDIPIYREICVC
jgi:hypothetical protein